jgi:xanthine dehydrogenase accessory factor
MINSDEILDRAAELKAAGLPFALATVVRAESPTAAKPGAKAVITQNGDFLGWIGGGCAQPAVLKTAKQSLRDGQARLIRVSPQKNSVTEAGIVDFGMTCHSGGTLDIFIDPVVARPSLVIVGASPTAQMLSSLADKAGFAVHVAAPEGTAALFPGARQVVDGFGLETLECGVPSFVIVATQGKGDEAALVAALALGAKYLGFVASERKAEKIKASLIDNGHVAQKVDAIISPVGIEIGAVTPEEVAVSILAAMIQERRTQELRNDDDVKAASSLRPETDAAGPAVSSCGGGDQAKTAAKPNSPASCCDAEKASQGSSKIITVPTAAVSCCGSADAESDAAIRPAGQGRS